MRRQRYAEARDFFSSLAGRNIRLAESCVALGKCNFKLHLYEEAKAALHRALEASPAPDIMAGVLEVTNWQMVASHKYYNGWPAFSPDGRFLAYVSARRDTNGDGKLNADDCGAVYIADLENGSERIIVSDDYHNSRPVFSPDGKSLAYLSVRSRTPSGAIDQRANPGLYLMDLASGRETLLLDDRYRVKYQCFTPDAKKIFFSGWEPGGRNSGIYALEIAGGAVATIVSGLFETTFPSLAPNGDKLVYSSWRKDTNGDGMIDFHDHSSIFFKYLVGGHEEVPASSDRYNSSFPSFSPDGRQIVFLSVRRDTNKDGKIDALDNPGIYCMDILRKKEYCIVDDTYFNKFASFLPDGKRIVFVSNWRRLRGGDEEARDYFEHKGIYITDIYGKNIEQVVSDKYYGSRSPVVSPRGNRVACISWRDGTNRGLYLAHLDRLPSVTELHEWIDRNL